MAISSIEELIGPSSGAWSGLPGEHGKVAYFTSDGDTGSPPPDGVRRPAKLLRVEFPQAPRAPVVASGEAAPPDVVESSIATPDGAIDLGEQRNRLFEGHDIGPSSAHSSAAVSCLWPGRHDRASGQSA